MNSIKHSILAGLSALALVAPASAAQGQITAQIEPRSIGLGDSAQLSVTVNGSRAAEPNVPHVDGLDIAPVGQQSSMQMTNGAVTSNVSHIYQVTPSHSGNFTIPAISAPGAGSTQPIAFRVDQGGGSRASAAPAPRRSQPPSPGVTEEDTAPDAKNQPAFLRVTLPKRELTVGELVPVEVKAYFRAGVSASLNGLPMLSSDAFSLNKLSDQPEQTREKIDGVPYSVVTWSSSLSAVKAGEYPVNLDLPVMVRVQEPARRRSGGGRNPFKDFFREDSPFGDSLFDDSFFDNFFGGMTEKPMTLHTDGAEVKIKPLPLPGQPTGFSGAVGSFDVTSEAPATSGATGDPMKLKIIVTGTGNFSRVSTDGLRASAAWKTYKPSGKFEPTDSSGVSGSKTFEQSIIALHAGAQEVPSVSFSYFDPEKDAYVTKETKPIAVEIAPGAAAPTASAVAPPPVTAPADAGPKIAPDGLAADEAVPAHATASLRPLVLQPWFIALNAAMLAALVIAALVIGAIVRAVHARREQDPDLAQRGDAERAVTASLAAMDAALAAKDAPRFFDAARHALQERLAAQWHVPASRVTIPEIRARLNGSGEDVRAVFQTADEIAYSGRRFTTPDLQKWRDLVQTQLQQLSRI